MRLLQKYIYPFYLRISKLQSCFYFKLNSSVEVLATNLDAKQYLITTLALMVSKYCCCQDKNQRSPSPTQWSKSYNSIWKILENKETCFKVCLIWRYQRFIYKKLGILFPKLLRSLEQFIWTVKSQTNFGNRMLFNLFLEDF